MKKIIVLMVAISAIAFNCTAMEAPTTIATERQVEAQKRLDSNLIRAIRAQDSSQVSQWLANGANIYAKDESGKTALEIAYDINNAEIVGLVYAKVEKKKPETYLEAFPKDVQGMIEMYKWQPAWTEAIRNAIVQANENVLKKFIPLWTAIRSEIFEKPYFRDLIRRDSAEFERIFRDEISSVHKPFADKNSLNRFIHNLALSAIDYKRYDELEAILPLVQEFGLEEIFIKSYGYPENATLLDIAKQKNDVRMINMIQKAMDKKVHETMALGTTL